MCCFFQRARKASETPIKIHWRLRYVSSYRHIWFVQKGANIRGNKGHKNSEILTNERLERKGPSFTRPSLQLGPPSRNPLGFPLTPRCCLRGHRACCAQSAGFSPSWACRSCGRNSRWRSICACAAVAPRSSANSAVPPGRRRSTSRFAGSSESQP